MAEALDVKVAVPVTVKLTTKQGVVEATGFWNEKTENWVRLELVCNGTAHPATWLPRRDLERLLLQLDQRRFAMVAAKAIGIGGAA